MIDIYDEDMAASIPPRERPAGAPPPVGNTYAPAGPPEK
jgi:hypothetical protein